MNEENKKQIKKGMKFNQARMFDKIHLAKSKLLFLKHKYEVQDVDDFRYEEVQSDNLFKEILNDAITRYEKEIIKLKI